MVDIESHMLNLSKLQVGILLDTVSGFVDNKKLLHIPNHQGEIISLPLTLESLHEIEEVMEKNEIEESFEFKVELQKADKNTIMKIMILNTTLQYHLNLDEFDPV